MKQLLNTLYIMTQGAYLSLDHETVKVEVEGKAMMQVPLHHLGSIVTVGNVMISPFLAGKCAEEGRTVAMLDRNGRFLCRMVGRTTGNVLLRAEQYENARDRSKAALIARQVVAGKIRNSRSSVMRSARETPDKGDETALRQAADALERGVFDLSKASDIDVIRGIEGEAASRYYEVFGLMVSDAERGCFSFKERNRRPPLDPMNALLSFLYTLLLHDCVSALEGVGLDPQIGFLHALRPGRPSLGLDLMEELRPVLADRLALTLINRKQITGDDFDHRPGGAVYLNEKGRKETVVAYQKRKQEELHHPLLAEKTPLGLVPHIQARLMARHIRGDMGAYLPYIHG